MIAGFAMVAYPAQYGESGVMTFIVSHNGKSLREGSRQEFGGDRRENDCVRPRCRLEGSAGAVATFTAPSRSSHYLRRTDRLPTGEDLL